MAENCMHISLKQEHVSLIITKLSKSVFCVRRDEAGASYLYRKETSTDGDNNKTFYLYSTFLNTQRHFTRREKATMKTCHE